MGYMARRGKMNNEIIIEKPLELLSHLRFDITAKTLYARHRDKGVEKVWAQKVYEHHIDVWGGFSEIDPPKNGKKDFYESYHKVLDSIKNEGFLETESYIPIYENNNLLNGSHRVAAAINYNKPVVCKNSSIEEGQLECHARYFKDKRYIVPSGLLEEVSDAMALEYTRLKKNTHLATAYQHTLSSMNVVFNTFKKHNIKVVYSKDIELTLSGQLNYLLALYGDEEWMMSGEESGFPGAKSQWTHNFSQGPLVKAILIECDNGEAVHEAKQEIRELVGRGKGAMHTTDTRKETWRNACMCFHNPTLNYLNSCTFGFFHMRKFREFILETKKIIKNSNIDVEDLCVGGSAPLMAYGKRECRDFDVLHLPPVDSINFNDIVSSHNDYIKYYGESIEEIIFNPHKHFYIDGIKFILPEGMIKMKSNRGEQKDHRDVELMKEVL